MAAPHQVAGANTQVTSYLPYVTYTVQTFKVLAWNLVVQERLNNSNGTGTG